MLHLLPSPVSLSSQQPIGLRVIEKRTHSHCQDDPVDALMWEEDHPNTHTSVRFIAPLSTSQLPV